VNPWQMLDDAVLLVFWRNFLVAQDTHFRDSYFQQTGTAYAADDLKAAFLVIDDELAKEGIEKAVAAFLDSGWPASWRPLTPRECLHLGFRVGVALAVIKQIEIGTPEGMTFKKVMLRDLKDFQSGVRWLFLGLWKMGGRPFLCALADDIIRKTTAPDSGK
jgi:hypothetical protein